MRRQRGRGWWEALRLTDSRSTAPAAAAAAGTETEDRLQRRLAGAVRELAAAERMEWDARIVNDDLPAAYARLRGAVEGVRSACRAEREAETH